MSQGWRQHCFNVSPILWQRSFVYTFKHPSNVVWTSRQHCVNVVVTLYFDQNLNAATTLSRLWWTSANVVTTLCECCGNVVTTLGTDVETMFRQRCVNVAMLCEHCGNVALNVGDRHCNNVQAMLCEHCGNVTLNVGDRR